MKDALKDAEDQLASQHLQIELTKQDVQTIKADIAEMKAAMSSFLKKLEDNYVTRKEFESLVKRHEALETRFWGLVVAFLVACAGWVFNALR